MDKPLLSVEEFCEYLGIGKQKLVRFCGNRTANL